MITCRLLCDSKPTPKPILGCLRGTALAHQTPPPPKRTKKIHRGSQSEHKPPQKIPFWGSGFCQTYTGVTPV